jgi:hypothetical protein
VAEIAQGYGVHPRREASGGVAFLFFVQFGYTGIAAPDTRCACGEARNR